MSDEAPGRRTDAGKAAPRTTRRTRAELEQLLLAAGRELLVRDGITLGLDSITFKRVFDHLEASRGIRVTYASVIERIWRDQSAFHIGVVLSVLDQTFSDDPFFDESLQRMVTVATNADRSTPEGRWNALFEVCRVGADDNLMLLQNDVWWPLWLNVWTWLATTAETPTTAVLAEALRKNYTASDDVYESLFSLFIRHLGFREAPGFTLAQIDTMLAWSAEGAAIRQRVDPAALEPVPHDGQRWTPLGLSFKAIVMLALELVPDWTPPDD